MKIQSLRLNWLGLILVTLSMVDTISVHTFSPLGNAVRW